MTPDPDLYGPPEYEPDDPGQDDDWEALMGDDPFTNPVLRALIESDNSDG